MGREPLKVMAIGAHPDDCEYMFGGTAIRYMEHGHVVRFVSATNGNAGHQSMGRVELAARRAGEARAVSALAGVEYEILDNNDGELQADLVTREMVIASIRRFSPDMIFTHRANDYHADHRNTALLVQDSSFLLGVPHICPQVPALRHMPVVLNVFDTFKKPLSFQADIAVDIGDAMDGKIRMLDCHRSQFYEWLPWIEQEEGQVPAGDGDRLMWLGEKIKGKDAFTADCCRTQLLERYGAVRGGAVRFAEAFEVSEYGAQLQTDMVGEFFPF